METKRDRQELCVAACDGIPDSYLIRGYAGLKAWFANKGIEHDTPISLGELGRYLPWRRGRSYMYKLAKAGLDRKDGLNLKLETFEFDGFAASTVENYFRLILRMDGSQIVSIEKRTDDSRLCMAICSTCGEFLKFSVKENEVRELVCRQYNWQLMDDLYWQCNKCSESLCRNQKA